MSRLDRLGAVPAYIPHLTPRDLKILKLLNRGLEIAEIAARLGVPYGGASLAITRVRYKLGGGLRDEVLEHARALGLVPTPKGMPRPSARRLAKAGPLRPRLLPRAQQVLELMNRGLTTPQIAARLRVSIRVVYECVSTVGSTIGGRTRYEVVQRARQLQLIQEPADGGIQEIALTKSHRRLLETAAAHVPVTRIAHRLGRSVGSVSRSLRMVEKRLQSDSAMEALDRAVDLGLTRVPKQKEVPQPLTQRECDVLEGLFAGLSQRKIAKELGLNRGNFYSHFALLKSKLRVLTRDELLDEVERLRLYTPCQPRKRLVARDTMAKRLPPSHAVAGLTPRQIEVIQTLSSRREATLTEIAQYLGFSRSRLQTHLNRIRLRLGVRKSIDIPEAAAKLGLVRLRKRNSP
ncbi:MAG TPA: LuxR C-terminal-related transcriptional regulator [Candidatus Baltobacteraceae bacterium]